MEIKELLKELRKNYGVKVPVYNYLGEAKGYKNLPLYYSDTQKLCFPNSYYPKKEMEAIKKYLEEKIGRELILKENTYIGGLHCTGWTISLKIK